VCLLGNENVVDSFLLNWEFSRCSGVALIRGFNDLYCDVLSGSYSTEDYFYNCVCVRAP
jgi:hypothetical protein